MSVTDTHSRISAEMVIAAAKTCSTCGNCGRGIHPHEPIRRCTFYKRGFAWRSAPVCAQCWNTRTGAFDLTTGMTSDHDHDLAERFGQCDGCGRLVAPANRKSGQRWLLCSERCRAVVKARCKAEMDETYRVSPPTTTCSACGESFTPSRADARYCSSACRQRAYRQREAGTPTTHSEHPTTRGGAGEPEEITETGEG